MPYDRWGITAATAATITGKAEADLTDAVLDAAEAEIVDAIGWIPDPDLYDLVTPDVRARAFGRAIAWQAAHRLDTPAGPTDGSGVAIASEALGGDYSVTYGPGGATVDPLLSSRARDLLARAGWFRNAGATVGSATARQSFDDWQRNRI